MEDVVIVGAGPVGLMLACELRLAGARPIVLEKRAEPGDLPKANGLGGQVIELFDHRGLLDRVRSGSPFAGRPPGFPFGSVPLRFAGMDDIPLQVAMIQQPRLERLLGERAAELGVEIRWGQRLRTLAQDDEGVTLEGDGFRLRARYAVGCDGGRSLVREQAGIGFPGTTDDEVMRMGHFKAPSANIFEHPQALGLHDGWNRTPNGRVLITSLQPGVYIAGVREKGALPSSPITLDDFQAAVRRVLGHDLPLGEPIWVSSTVSQARLADRYRAGRVFLAGDAAHLFPAGGSALNVGLTDAANLGWKLGASLRGRAPNGLLDTYEAERRPVGERTLLHTRAQATLDRLSGEDGTALRDLLTELFALEQPARRLAGMLHGSDIRYGEATHPLAGRFAPDLELTTETGRTRVAELMREARPLLLDLRASSDLPDAGHLPDAGLPDVGRLRDPGDLPEPKPGDLPASIEDGWIRVVRAHCDDPPAEALLIRPDGYVAWAGTTGLDTALATWFTP